jgi:hypothetical protein
VVDKAVLGQVFSKYFSFPFQSSFHQLLHNHPHLSSEVGTKGQMLRQYNGLSSTQLALKKTVFRRQISQAYSKIYIKNAVENLKLKLNN